MYTFVTILIIIVSILLVLIILVQNSKGGGLASGFSSSNQIMGVRRTADLLEKITWGMAIGLVTLCLLASLTLPNANTQAEQNSDIQEQIDNATVPAGNLAPPPATNPAPNPQ